MIRAGGPNGSNNAARGAAAVRGSRRRRAWCRYTWWFELNANALRDGRRYTFRVEHSDPTGRFLSRPVASVPVSIPRLASGPRRGRGRDRDVAGRGERKFEVRGRLTRAERKVRSKNLELLDRLRLGTDRLAPSIDDRGSHASSTSFQELCTEDDIDIRGKGGIGREGADPGRASKILGSKILSSKGKGLRAAARGRRRAEERSASVPGADARSGPAAARAPAGPAPAGAPNPVQPPRGRRSRTVAGPRQRALMAQRRTAGAADAGAAPARYVRRPGSATLDALLRESAAAERRTARRRERSRAGHPRGRGGPGRSAERPPRGIGREEIARHREVMMRLIAQREAARELRHERERGRTQGAARAQSAPAAERPETEPAGADEGPPTK
jgi:hypothetical protein